MTKSLVALSLLALAGCDTVSPPPPACLPSSGPSCYDYTAFDTAGRPAVQGVLLIEMGPGDAGQVEGAWQTVQLVGASTTGPQIGAGTLAGVLTDESFVILLQSSLTGGLVELTGQVEGGVVLGRWSYEPDTGIPLEGVFEAKPAAGADATP